MNEADLLESLGESAEYAEANIGSSVTVGHTDTPGTTSSVEDRALQLLGAGISSSQVASAIGVSESRISQLLADDIFAGKVSELRYKSLTEHNLRDNKYDKLEDMLIEKLEKSAPLMIRPETILKAITVVNGAKRRGQSHTNTVTDKQNIVQLILPTKVTQKFTTNINNQVIRAGEQELMTMPSTALMSSIEEEEIKEVTYVHEPGGES